jgi:hypothetical protein
LQVVHLGVGGAGRGVVAYRPLGFGRIHVEERLPVGDVRHRGADRSVLGGFERSRDR